MLLRHVPSKRSDPKCCWAAPATALCTAPGGRRAGSLRFHPEQWGTAPVTQKYVAGIWHGVAALDTPPGEAAPASVLGQGS